MRRWILLGGAGLVLVGLLLFEPWTLFQDSTVDESLPPEATTADVESVVLAQGEFVRQEHPTAGAARVIALHNGKRVLRLEGFSTSNGPDLHVWLSEETAGGNWFKYRTARHIELGELKANNGNQNYELPASADLDGIRSAVIWCKRFSVAFGSAPLSRSPE
jgi:hypothetical protein